MMDWCERQGIDYVFGLAKNPRLLKEIAEELNAAEAESVRTGEMARMFKNLRYRTLDVNLEPHTTCGRQSRALE